MSYKDFFYLDHAVKIYVPSTNAINQPAPELQAKFTDLVLTRFASMFGGATVAAAVGAWSDPVAGLVKERINIVYSNCTSEQLEDNITNVIELAQMIREEMQQTAITVEIDGKITFIEA